MMEGLLMHSFVAFVFGVMCAWAVPQSKKAASLGKWRPLSGGLAAIFPHIDIIFLLFGRGEEIFIQFSRGITWNPLLVPLYSLVLAAIIGKISKKSWQVFFPIVLISMLLSVLLAIFTFEGIKPFYPVSDMVLSLSAIHSFDLTILGIALAVVVLDFALGNWGRDISRIAIVAIAIYIGVVITFSWRAEGMAEQYAEALGLEGEAYALPQPISPMNWRLIVTTSDDRIHDTLVNIGREDELEVKEDSNRASRINALYKPLNKAVWRIYRRFGKDLDKSTFVKDVWMAQPSWLQEYIKFHVFRKLTMKDNVPCVQFKDIRTIGAKNVESGIVTFCKKANGEYLNTLQ